MEGGEEGGSFVESVWRRVGGVVQREIIRYNRVGVGGFIAVGLALAGADTGRSSTTKWGPRAVPLGEKPSPGE